MHRSKLQQRHLYSITSSARASSDGGTSRPSAFAVLHVTYHRGDGRTVGPGPELLWFDPGTEGSPTRPMTYCGGTADE
jgi:hypothetical protein